MSEWILKQHAHRPWALPRGPWIIAQDWDDLLFAHWRMPVEELRRAVPRPLELDLFEGTAWLSIVPFTMRAVRGRGLPPLPGLSVFPELNLRTYVTLSDKPGVFFFSLDAANRAAVRTARRVFHLPYFDARMRSRRVGDEVRYRSERTHRGAPPARFAASYAPAGYPTFAQPGTLEHFLSERYCLYAVLGDGAVASSDIHHPPWNLQPATATIHVNTIAEAAGLCLPPDLPLLHYSASQHMVGWRPVRRDHRE